MKNFFNKYKTPILWAFSVLIFFAVIALYLFVCFIFSKFTIARILFTIISFIGGLFIVFFMIAIIHEIIKEKFD